MMTEPTTQAALPALLARLEAERAHHEECTSLSRINETRIAHSSMAAEDYAQLENHTDATCEAVQRRDDAEAALARVREYVETSDDDGIRTRETVLRIFDEGAEDQPGHVYLSTGCLHGEHDYCQKHTGLSGVKTPAVCKFCKSPCVCSCHREAK